MAKLIPAIAFALVVSVVTSVLTVGGMMLLDQQPVTPTRTFYNIGEKPTFWQKEVGWTAIQTWDTCCMVVTLVGPEPGLYQPRDDKFRAGNTYFYPGRGSLAQAYKAAMMIVEENRRFPATFVDPTHIYSIQFTPAPPPG